MKFSLHSVLQKALSPLQFMKHRIPDINQQSEESHVYYANVKNTRNSGSFTTLDHLLIDVDISPLFQLLTAKTT